MRNTIKQSLLKIAMMCDSRLPFNSVGYVDDLHNDTCKSVLQDRLIQLSKYIPNLVDEYRATLIN